MWITIDARRTAAERGGGNEEITVGEGSGLKKEGGRIERWLLEMGQRISGKFGSTRKKKERVTEEEEEVMLFFPSFFVLI